MASFALVLAGCINVVRQAPNGFYRNLSTVIRYSHGNESRLFSRVGYMALSDSQRRTIAGLYNASGLLSRDALEKTGNSLHIEPWGDGYRILFNEGVARDVVVMNGFLIGLDHRFDDYVLKMAGIETAPRRVLPPVPISINH